MHSMLSWVRQAAAIPIRSDRVCLVLSCGGKRLVVPKGGIKGSQTAGETALQEAWEEAGLVGTLQQEPLGSYWYEKTGTLCHVIVFVMHVTEVANDWPESNWRLRRWVSLAEALPHVREPGLRQLLRKLAAAQAL